MLSGLSRSLQEIRQRAVAEIAAGREQHVAVAPDDLAIAEVVVLDDVAQHVVVARDHLLEHLVEVERHGEADDLLRLRHAVGVPLQRLAAVLVVARAEERRDAVRRRLAGRQWRRVPVRLAQLGRRQVLRQPLPVGEIGLAPRPCPRRCGRHSNGRRSRHREMLVEPVQTATGLLVLQQHDELVVPDALA